MITEKKLISIAKTLKDFLIILLGQKKYIY